MFGYTIIRKDELNRLENVEFVYNKSLIEARNELEKVKKDLDSLRQQNGELRKTINLRAKELEKQAEKIDKTKSANEKLRRFKEDVMEVFGDVDFHSFRPIACNCQCDQCDHEQSDCKKYTIGELIFCMVRK